MKTAPTPSRKTYLFTYLGLMILLASTITAAFLPLGVFHTAVAVGIAIAKAFLVLLFFMHLRYSAGRTSLLLSMGLLLLMILFGLTLVDYFTRVNGLPFVP